MNTRIAVEKFNNNVLYYLQESDLEKKMKYQMVMGDAIKAIFSSMFPDYSDVEISFDVRSKIDVAFNDVIVLARMSPTYKNGESVYSTMSRKYIVSFAQDCSTKYSAEEITALTLYAFCTYLTQFTTQRVKSALLTVVNKYKLSMSSNEVNQLSAIFYYTLPLNGPYLIPTDKFENYPVLDMLFFVHPDFYNTYALMIKKYSSAHLKVIYGERHDSLNPDMEYKSPFIYYDKADELNQELITKMIRDDRMYCSYLTTQADAGYIENELEDVHNRSGMNIKLKDILTDDNRNPLMFTESVSGIMNESFFKPNESEFRYRLNKIIVASKYLDTEDERTAILVDMYNLKNKLTKFIDKEDARGIVGKTKKEEMDQVAKMEYLRTMLSELENLEANIVNAELKPKKFGVFIEYPAGYNY